MSDIYLQITETPTVVTLSAPVVSGALASTVTVANTVTVALDANSLSALENVTVTVGAAVTGTVTVSNFPASQAVTFSAVTISNFPATQTIAGTVTANAFGLDQGDGTSNAKIPIISFDTAIEAGSGGYVVPVQISNTLGAIGTSNALPISGTVTVGNTVNFLSGSDNDANLIENIASAMSQNNILGITNALPAGTNRIGVVTIGGGTVTIGAGTAQIGSVTASLAYSQTATTISSTAVTAIPVVFPTSGAWGGSLQGYNGSNTYIYSGIQAIGSTSLASATSLPVSLTTLPALAAGTAQIGSVTASISNSVVTFYPMQGTTVSSTNFTSVTASTTLVSAVANREVLTVFNETGTLFISPGATCTTVAYQIRLSAGDYWECPQGQQSLQHTAVYLTTGGTARVCQVS